MAAEDINIAFGKHLRGIRIQLGMNQDDVAAACGIDPTSISRLERGETNATLTTLQRLSKGLCIPLQDLMDLREVYQVTVVGEELLGEVAPGKAQSGRAAVYSEFYQKLCITKE